MPPMLIHAHKPHITSQNDILDHNTYVPSFPCNKYVELLLNFDVVMFV